MCTSILPFQTLMSSYFRLETSQAVSIVFFTDSWRPDSFYHRILANRKQGLHTLCLLDIKVKEPTEESLARGRKVYQPPRFMSIATAISQLLELESKLRVSQS